MRLTLPIRVKLLLATILPLLAVFGLVVAFNQPRLMEAARRRTEASLSERAGLAAARLDGLFETVAQIARSAAQFVTLHPDLTDEDLYELAAANVGLHPLVYGSCVAFDPGADPRGRARLAPYVCREGNGVRRLDIAGVYDYTTWEWFAAPRSTGRADWTEPYFDDGAGNIVMCTYSAPFLRDDVPAGVVTIDVPLAAVQRLVLDDPLLGRDVVVLSRRGNIVSHPLLLEGTTIQSIFDYADAAGLPGISILAREMMAGGQGVRMLEGLDPAGPSLVAYAPIPSTGWAFGKVMPKAEVMAPVAAELNRRLLLAVAGVGTITGVLILVSGWITRPIARLAGAVRELGTGNLDASAAGVRTRDEIGALARTFDAMVAQLKGHVEALTRETAARHAVESELRVAREIQQTLLPRTFPPFPDHSEFDLHAVNMPARHIGGDFFDFFFISDDVLLIAIADVSGKGAPAAMYMAAALTLLRNLAAETAGPGALLDRANAILARDNDRAMFLTLFLGLYETRTGRLRYANAGHPRPLLLNGVARPFGEVTGPLLGVMPEARFPEAEGRLESGQAIVLYTDGVSEARTADGEFFGVGRLEQLLGSAGGCGARDLCESTAREVDRFQAGELKDDVTVLALRRLR